MFESLIKRVSGSEDLTRILGLPRRHVNSELYVDPVTRALRKSGPIDTSAPYQLNAIQAWALYEIQACGGLLAPIGVGHGKTGLDILAPMVVKDCRVVVLLVPAALRDVVPSQFELWGRNFRVPNLQGSGRFDATLPTVYVVSYEQLSRESSARVLETISPDLIIADEAHKLRHKSSGRTRRVLYYFTKHSQTRFLCWSGTLTSRSIKDYAHLSELALRQGSPLPTHSGVVEDWAAALDARGAPFPVDPGPLASLCVQGESLREGFSRRVLETKGVVASKGDSVSCSLYLIQKTVEVPEVIRKALEELRATAVRPDGEELVDAIQLYRAGRELASGFYYRWIFPRGEPAAVIDKWFETRKEWHREVRDVLKKNRPLMDTPLMCIRAALRANAGYKGELPVWHSLWLDKWLSVKPLVRPKTEAVWLSDYLIKDCLHNRKEGIIWYEHDTFGEKLAAEGVTVFGAGVPAVVIEGAKGLYAAAIGAHGTGRNLQNQSLNIVANYPTDSAAWEQLMGRTHRQGQKANEVIVEVYRHTPELIDAFDKALEAARYQQETLKQPMKLLTASYGFKV